MDRGSNGEGRLTVNAKARHDSIARSEVGAVQQGSGRFVTLACDSEVYHSVADRWPEVVDVALLARNGVCERSAGVSSP